MKATAKGYLLLEIVVGLLLLALLMPAVKAVYDLSAKNWQAAQTKSEAAFNARLVLSFVARDLRQAHSFTVTEQGQRLELKRGEEGVSYYLAKGALHRAFYQNNYLRNTLPLTENLKKIEFSHVSKDLLALKVTVTAGADTYELESRLGLRLSEEKSDVY